MTKNPAGLTQCFTCEYWGGERQYEAAGYVSYEGPYATAACENSASTLYRNQVQPVSICNHWIKWRQI
jgi:hypothetical protein